MTPSLTLEQSPEAFATGLRALGHSRAAWFTRPDGGWIAAYPELEGIGQAIAENRRDFDRHDGVFIALGEKTGALLAAFVHKTVRGQAAGGVRYWRYESLGKLVEDGLRLSRGMGRKSALAGLWWGGGKGVIARSGGDVEDAGYRRELYEDYGRFVSSLRGVYVTAEDVGTSASDMASIFHATRFVTCIPEPSGGSGNPSGATARGVVCAMQAALEYAKLGALAGKRIAVQGAGNVAGFMIGHLLEQGVAAVEVVDISEQRIAELCTRYPDQRLRARAVSAADESIFETPCDLFAPCALGGILEPRTIAKMRCKVVCGAANNQLLDDQRDGASLAARGIVFVPDFVANRMGIVQCANEQYGSLPHDPSILRHFDPSWGDSVHAVTLRVLESAEQNGTTPTHAANALADELSERPHPLWPERGRHILDSLARDWCAAETR